MKSFLSALVVGFTALMYVVPATVRPIMAREFDFIQAIIKPQLNIDQSRRIRQIVWDVGGKRWASARSGGVRDSVVMEPAGYSIVPTADLATGQAAAICRSASR